MLTLHPDIAIELLIIQAQRDQITQANRGRARRPIRR